MIFILMTPQEADSVATEFKEIIPCYQPVRRGTAVNEVYILPVSILSTPEYQSYFTFLNALPKIDYSDPNFPPPWNPEE